MRLYGEIIAVYRHMIRLGEVWSCTEVRHIKVAYAFHEWCKKFIMCTHHVSLWVWEVFGTADATLPFHHCHRGHMKELRPVNPEQLWRRRRSPTAARTSLESSLPTNRKKTKQGRW